MSLNIRFDVSGDDQFADYLERFPKEARKAAKLAINDTVRRARRKAKQQIVSQVNLTSSYVNQERLSENFASENNLVGSIVGRRRPTSLARFDTQPLYQANRTRGGRKGAGVSVRVKNQRQVIPRAFLIGLKSGSRDGGNRGLAIRVPKGQTPKRRFNAKPLYKNRESDVYLLYGPSINQVLTSDRRGPSVIQRLQPDLTSYLNQEFKRQFGRLYG